MSLKVGDEVRVKSSSPASMALYKKYSMDRVRLPNLTCPCHIKSTTPCKIIALPNSCTAVLAFGNKPVKTSVVSTKDLIEIHDS